MNIEEHAASNVVKDQTFYSQYRGNAIFDTTENFSLNNILFSISKQEKPPLQMDKWILLKQKTFDTMGKLEHFWYSFFHILLFTFAEVPFISKQTVHNQELKKNNSQKANYSHMIYMYIFELNFQKRYFHILSTPTLSTDCCLNDESKRGNGK